MHGSVQEKEGSWMAAGIWQIGHVYLPGAVANQVPVTKNIYISGLWFEDAGWEGGGRIKLDVTDNWLWDFWSMLDRVVFIQTFTIPKSFYKWNCDISPWQCPCSGRWSSRPRRSCWRSPPSPERCPPRWECGTQGLPRSQRDSVMRNHLADIHPCESVVHRDCLGVKGTVSREIIWPS